MVHLASRRSIVKKVAKIAANPQVRKIRLVENIVYSVIQDPDDVSANRPLKMDVLQASEQEGVKPAIVWLPGGGWLGVRKDFDIPSLLPYAVHGYTVFSVEYRTSGVAKYPAQIEDAKAAVRYIRVHAAFFGVDPNRIGVMGRSAGGHLAALLGTTGEHREFDHGDWLAVSSRVQAAVDFFGPTDLLQIAAAPSALDWASPQSFAAMLLGGPVTDRVDLARRANPITYLSSSTCPFLILHGDRDDWVPCQQSQLLYEALTRAGIPAVFYELTGSGHGTPEFYQPEVHQLVFDFLDAHL